MAASVSFYQNHSCDILLCKDCNLSLHVDYAIPPTPAANTILRSGHMPSDMERQSILRTIETMEDCDNELEKQLAALDTQRKQLEQARSTISSALIVQKAYLTPIRRLPLEILSNVMAWACEGEIDLAVRVCPPLALSAVCKTWRDLYLIDSARSVGAVEDFVWIKNRPLPLLRKLGGTVRHLELAVESGVFEGFSSLRCVVISNEQNRNAIPALPWGQLEVLDTRLCSNAYALQVLQQCHQLRSWNHTVLRIEPGLWAPPSLVRLKHLRVINIHIPFNSVRNPLQHLITPALESLSVVWENGARYPFATRAIPAFVARSSCTLCRLELSAPFFIDYDCLLALRDVRTLHLKGSDYAPINQPFIDRLITGDLFPLLETLELSGNLTFSNDSIRELVRVRESAECTLQQITLDFTEHDIARHGPYRDVVNGLREVPPVYVRS
ncbi:uncharacterized protein SCHCODRAFT_02744332 [Schizophyllum commune H4-8]|uniref:uncharacterized protein n=1 Tax=Schizophyllum commune (strain H4-8 / FGSC 9210) TaxID=578458 RepID=UPI002160413B|nr:uncharacterized protein SCHCODRAFT_02744332 [Schizophyllum commune H4-8]KAI5898028.1 hypothetical protein SCHCODRAFT_02744332 [Schizophyllum commune H4-8]